MDKVSIIIPVYNKEKYLGRCLESIDNQNYDEIEVVLIDDGSFDGSLSVCKEYQEKTKYDCIVFHQENKGPSGARNKGLELITGDYVLFLDADDALTNDCIFMCMEHMKRKQYDFIEYEFGNEYIQEERENSLREIENDKIIINLLKNKYIKPLVCGAIYNSEVIRNIKFEEEMKWGEDSCFKLQVCMQSKIVGYINERLYINYLVPGTLSRMECNNEMLKSVDILIKFYLSKLKYNNMKNYIGRFVFNTAFSYISLITLQGKKIECKNGYLILNKYTKDYYKYADFTHKLAYHLMKFDRTYSCVRMIFDDIHNH